MVKKHISTVRVDKTNKHHTITRGSGFAKCTHTVIVPNDSTRDEEEQLIQKGVDECDMKVNLKRIQRNVSVELDKKGRKKFKEGITAISSRIPQYIETLDKSGFFNTSTAIGQKIAQKAILESMIHFNSNQIQYAKSRCDTDTHAQQLMAQAVEIEKLSVKPLVFQDEGRYAIRGHTDAQEHKIDTISYTHQIQQREQPHDQRITELNDMICGLMDEPPQKQKKTSLKVYDNCLVLPKMEDFFGGPLHIQDKNIFSIMEKFAPQNPTTEMMTMMSEIVADVKCPISYEDALQTHNMIHGGEPSGPVKFELLLGKNNENVMHGGKIVEGWYCSVVHLEFIMVVVCMWYNETYPCV